MRMTGDKQAQNRYGRIGVWWDFSYWGLGVTLGLDKIGAWWWNDDKPHWTPSIRLEVGPYQFEARLTIPREEANDEQS